MPSIEMVMELRAEIERLRAELKEFTELKEYAKSLGQETYLELHAKNERLRVALRPFAASFQFGAGYNKSDFEMASVAYGPVTVNEQKAPCPHPGDCAWQTGKSGRRCVCHPCADEQATAEPTNFSIPEKATYKGCIHTPGYAICPKCGR